MAVLASGTLVGISYNDVSLHNEVHSVDPNTGVTTLLSSFDFSSGGWYASLIPDVEAGVFYAESGDAVLYKFDGSTGAILETAALDTLMQAMAVLSSDSIVISDCDTGVPNKPLSDGSLMSEELESCLALPPALARRCAIARTRSWFEAGLITRAERRDIHTCLGWARPGRLGG